MSKRWSIEEDVILSDLLTDGIKLSVLDAALNSRTADAIIRRASSKGYRLETLKDGAKKLYHGVKRRKKHSKGKATEQNLAVTNSVTKSKTLDVDILSNNTLNSNICITGLDANSVAIKILCDNHLSIEPLIVYQLSQHILHQNKE